MNRDVIGLLVHHLDPKSALELRRCNKKLNKWVSHNQLYWYYQHLAYEGRKRGASADKTKKEAAGIYRVHVKQWGLACINDSGYCSPDYKSAYEWLIQKDPTLSTEFDITLREHNAQALNAANHNVFINVRPPGYAENRAMRAVCLNHYRELDHKFCGRPDHFESAFDEKAQIGKHTRGFTEAKADEATGLFLFKFLFLCYRDTRHKVKLIKTPVRAAVKAKALHDQIRLLESQINEAKTELAVMEEFPRLIQAVQTSVFNRRSEKTYHKRKEVVKTFE